MNQLSAWFIADLAGRFTTSREEFVVLAVIYGVLGWFILYGTMGGIALYSGRSTPGVFNSIVHPLLLGLYGLYVFAGAALVSSGVYSSGVTLLIIGGIALFANLQQNWPALLFIEFINVALFTTSSDALVALLSFEAGSQIGDVNKEKWCQPL